MKKSVVILMVCIFAVSGVVFAKGGGNSNISYAELIYKLQTLPDNEREFLIDDLRGKGKPTGKKVKWYGVVRSIDSDGTLNIEMDLHIQTKSPEYEIEMSLSDSQNYKAGDGVFVSGNIMTINKLWWVKWVALLENKRVEKLSPMEDQRQLRRYQNLVKKFPRTD